MKTKKAQTKMDVIKLIIGVIGFVIIILTALLVIQPGKTGSFLAVTGRAVQSCTCQQWETCLNSNCETQPSITSLTQNPEFEISYFLEKTIIGFGGETRAIITLINNGENKELTPLPPIVRKNSQVVAGWAFTLDTTLFSFSQKSYKTLVLEIKSPTTTDSNEQKNLHGEQEILIPFQISGGEIIYETINIGLGLLIDRSVKKVLSETTDDIKLLREYTNTQPCSESYLIIKEDPVSLNNRGVAEIIIPFCNEGDFHETYSVRGVLWSYGFYQQNRTDCIKKISLDKTSNDYTDPFTCEVPFHKDCSGSFDLIVLDNFPDDTIENHGWTFTREGYCFLEPHNAFFEELTFNNDQNTPTITTKVLNRFGEREVTTTFFVTNTAGEEIAVCENTQIYLENKLKTINCLVEKNGYPYSFWGDGLLGLQDKNIRAEITSNEYQGDNKISIVNQPAFEYINVGVVQGSLTAQKDETDYHAKFSFQIVNNGDLDKNVYYELKGKRITTLTDAIPEEHTICTGTKNVPAGQAVLVNCELQTGTIINCDPEDGCVYDHSRTLWATIDVEHQDAQIFDAQETTETNYNSFIVPIFEEVSANFETPTLE